MGNAVVDLFLVRISLSITLADTLGNNAGVALVVTSVLAIFALHTRRVLKEISAEGTAHDVVKLVLDKLVAEHFVNFLLALSNSTLSAQTEIHLSLVSVFLDETEFELNLSS